MRTSRCIFYTVITTLFCVLYVFQQTEIVKLGYKINSTQKILEAMLDKKTSLEYTLSNLESPSSLDKNLFLKNENFEIAQGYKLVKISPSSKTARRHVVAKPVRQAKSSGVGHLALQSLFGSKQAEAKTIK